jgi:hypothetical protein
MATCLYCKRAKGPFTSREHCIPESLGNQGHGGKQEIMLPRSVVCDKCNHGVLSTLDRTLIDFMPISLMRTFYGVRSKSGKLPETKLSNAKLRMFAPGHIVLEPNSPKALVDRGNGRFDLNLLSNRKATPEQRRDVARALFKMTLGCMYIDQPDVALSERFDPERRMILGEEDFHGYVTMVARAWVPTADNMRSGLYYDFLEGSGRKPTVWTRLDFWRTSLFTDLEARIPQKPTLLPGDKAEILEF